MHVFTIVRFIVCEACVGFKRHMTFISVFPVYYRLYYSYLFFSLIDAFCVLDETQRLPLEINILYPITFLGFIVVFLFVKILFSLQCSLFIHVLLCLFSFFFQYCSK